MAKETKTKTKSKSQSKTKKKDYSEITFFDEKLECEGTIRIRKNKNKHDSCTISIGSFAIYGKIIETADTYFIGYPSYKDKDGEYHNVAFCFDKDTIENINNALFDFYENGGEE